MTPYWFTKRLPASRHGIENALRLAFWAAGFGETYFTCVQAEPPVKCAGTWRTTHPLSVEWVPLDYFVLRMKEVDQDAFDAFERVLGHRASVAFHDENGDVVVEWRTRDAEARYRELEQAGARSLEKLT